MYKFVKKKRFLYKINKNESLINYYNNKIYWHLYKMYKFD